MHTSLNRVFTFFAFLILIAGAAVHAEENSPENPMATAVSDAETILKASALHLLTVNVRNTHGAASSLTIEIREGGCEGKSIARFPLRGNDSVSYNCTADFVRIVADDPANSKYSYDVTFRKSERKPLT